MNFKNIIFPLVALGGTACWGAANNPFNNVSDEVIEYMAKHFDPQALIRMAQSNQRFYNIINKMPLYQLLNQYNGNLEAILFEAARTNRPEMINYLSKHGVNIDATNNDNDQMTALMLAARDGQKDIVTTLLNNGANVMAQDAIGRTALVIAVDGNHEKIVDEILKNITASDDCDIDVPDNDDITALEHAIMGNNIIITIKLLDNGADPLYLSQQAEERLEKWEENGML